MKRFMKKLAPVVSLAALGFGSVASAGYTYEASSCFQNADGSGYCTGTMRGWRYNEQSTSYATFYETDAGTKYFIARYTVSGAPSAGTYSCTPDSAVGAMWAEAVANRGRFSIYWNTSGACYALYLYNGSAYSTF
jgi:hypothetical protein